VSAIVTIDLPRVARNAEEIKRRIGVKLLAVIKADAYGLGARAVAEALSDIADGFCVFSLAEAQRIHLRDIARKPILSIGPHGDATADDFLAAGVNPAVWTLQQARRFRAARPALCVDTGMQRFACPPDLVADLLAVGNFSQAFTHAIRPDQAARLVALAGGRGHLPLHAAGSALLDDATCRLDAVRPGLALYRGAVRIAAPLIELHDTAGPAGYTGFVVPRHGVIGRGYSHGLRPGPCLVNGRRWRVLEVGMQTAFVEAAASDRVGDEVVLIGDGLEADEIGSAWEASGQQVLVSFLRSRA
jgi:alanine racemase